MNKKIISVVLFFLLFAFTKNANAALPTISNLAIATYSDAAILEWDTDTAQQMSVFFSPTLDCVTTDSISCTSIKESKAVTHHKVLLAPGTAWWSADWKSGNKLYYQIGMIGDKGSVNNEVIRDVKLGLSYVVVSNLRLEDRQPTSFKLLWESTVPSSAEIFLPENNQTYYDQSVSTSHFFIVNNILANQYYSPIIVPIISDYTNEWQSATGLGVGVYKIPTPTPSPIEAKSDLTIKDIIEIPAAVGVKGVRVKYSNIGQTLARTNFKIKLKDNNGSYASEAVDSQPADFMANEERYKDFSLSNGTYNFIATIDSDNIISEMNENNNTLEKIITITNSSNNLKCSDSDNGVDYYNKGTGKGIAFWGKSLNMIESFDDFCSGGNELNEISCGSDGYVHQENVKCEHGCWLGACCGPEGCKKENFCKDTDNGKNYSESGVVSVTKYNDILKFNDKCVITAPTQDGTNFYVQDDDKYYSSADKCSGNDCYIAEAFCSGVNDKFKVIKCSSCENGACVGYNKNETSDDSNKIELAKDNYDAQINKIKEKVNLLQNDKANEILAELKQLRDQVREQAAELKYLKGFAIEMKALTSNMQSAIKIFITYGVDDNT